MPSPIAAFPPEVFTAMLANLTMGDFARVLRVSHAYHTFVEPLLWTRIEMHPRDFHAQNAQDALMAEERAARPLFSYALAPELSRRDSEDLDGHERGERFLATFSGHETWGKGISEERRRALGRKVEFLCLPIHREYREPAVDPWNPFVHFENLVHLEISTFWVPPDTATPFTAPDYGLANLKTVKLRGYVDVAFVRWVLSEPAGIEELQLGILDAPVGTVLVGRERWVNPPALENRDLEYTDEEVIQSLTDEERARFGTGENLEHERVAPRARACLTRDIVVRMKSLKKVYLYKPSNGDKLNEDFLYFSEVSDKAILDEWAALLRAARATLESVTLDSRPVAEENCGDGTTNQAYVRMCANGPSYRRFVERVLPVLLEHKMWPNLQAVRLFGFERFDEGVEPEYYGDPDYPDGSVDVPGQLQDAFPEAAIESYRGRRTVIWNESGEIISGGDVLETANGFDTDEEEEEDE
ncbi:hypothetical protein K491DRAFT_717081 [Lophiostoma macrostomum CBS 122681]|uniref:F-box domain-containing protein n=1 Tax=Lophiostoma macrostomum CBS 122681 TaxID=1314788 RepID=A0A6A6T327_9PLEO|nr:hypothetical protein K491DRAFT_717081 [Lophiostoma macrostomum CBS 122681]